MAHNGFNVEFIPLDITSDQSIRAAIDELRERGEGLDLLINNAGVLPDAPIGADPERSSVLHTDRRCLREALEANTFGPLMLIQAALPILNKGARIINLSSGMGQLTEMGGHYR
ncbi:MAG: SDR family oxidoreductase [gamma proteobacterium symbiont of Phacoides pectinatus]